MKCLLFIVHAHAIIEARVDKNTGDEKAHC